MSYVEASLAGWCAWQHNALKCETTKNVDSIVAAYQCCHSAPDGSCCMLFIPLDKLLWLNARTNNNLLIFTTQKVDNKIHPTPKDQSTSRRLQWAFFKRHKWTMTNHVLHTLLKIGNSVSNRFPNRGPIAGLGPKSRLKLKPVTFQ